MNDMLSRLQMKVEINSDLTSEDIIHFQQMLAYHKFALLPMDFINFLYKYNGLNHQGNIVCGIFYQDVYADLLSLNERVKHPLHKDMVFLGYDTFDYLAYNQKYKCYQIIDKTDFEVIEEYQDFASALQYILKIEDE